MSFLLGTNTTLGATTGVSTGKLILLLQDAMNGIYFVGTTTGPARCQTENVIAEDLGVVEAELISETTKAETKVVGYIIGINGTGWTPSSAFSSLNIDFRHPVEVSQNNFFKETNERYTYFSIDWSNPYNS